MSALFSAGRVVDPVAGHRHDVPLPLEQVHQPDLVLGRHPGDHPDVVDRAQRLVVAHGPELGPGDHRAVDAELAGDRGRGHRVVAGDHPDLDAGRPGRGDGCLGGGPWRVDDPDQGEQLQIGHQREQVGAGVERGRVEVLARGGQHPQALLAQPLVLGQVQLPELAVGRHRPGVGVEDGRGARQQLVGGALDVAADHGVARTRRSSVWNVAISLYAASNGSSASRGYALPGRGRVDAALGGQRDQRALGRVADQLAVADHRVRGQDHRQQELIQRDLGLPRHPGDLALGRIARPLDRVPAAHHAPSGPRSSGSASASRSCRS